MKNNSVIKIEYFTDILCVWAYIAQIRIDELLKKYESSIDIEYRFCPVFSSTAQKMVDVWGDKGGFHGFNQHLLRLAKDWQHIEIHPDIWLNTRPASSMPVHIFLKSVQLLQQEGKLARKAMKQFKGRTVVEELVCRLRDAFFRGNEDISQRNVYMQIAADMNLPQYDIQSLVDSGYAHAALALDEQHKDKYRIQGSPTLVLNEGRQVLYGNVGFRIIEANIEELLHQPAYSEASWC